ncbi:MAG: DUF7402 domain-containing protein, partial [Planctomycetota bacterium]
MNSSRLSFVKAAAGAIRLINSMCVIPILLLSTSSYGQIGENLAPLASLSGPGENLQAAVDGVKQQDGTGEWIGGSPNKWHGWIDYPKLELKWDTPQKVNKVILYDRPSKQEHMAACVLRFSDGSEVHVFAVPNDGTAKTVVFEPRVISGVRLEVLDGVGENIGLSEIEFYDAPTANGHAKRKKNFTDYVTLVFL